jgi:hypothetical protein
MLICYLSMFSRKLEKLLKCVSFTFLKLIYKSLYRLLRFFCLPLISSFVCCEKFATTVSRGVYYCLLLPYIYIYIYIYIFCFSSCVAHCFVEKFSFLLISFCLFFFF